jgi:hypothetical protein
LRRPPRIDVQPDAAEFPGDVEVNFRPPMQRLCLTGTPRANPSRKPRATPFIALRNVCSRNDLRYAIRHIQSQASCC